MTTIVVNRHTHIPTKNDVYIGRGTKWGNPFIIGVHGTRKEVLNKYRHWLNNNQNLLQALSELKDKTLVCSCKPKACHGDIICEVIKNDNRTTVEDFCNNISRLLESTSNNVYIKNHLVEDVIGDIIITKSYNENGGIDIVTFKYPESFSDNTDITLSEMGKTVEVLLNLSDLNMYTHKYWQLTK